MSHWRHRRDNNEPALLKPALDLGAEFFKGPPFDGWLWFRGRWHLCEIKRPEKEGHADEFTKAQLVLIQRLRERQIPWHVLRTEDDVYALMGARRTA